MLDILKPIEIRSGSYQPLKIKVYDNNNQRVEDITEYELKLLIIKDEYSTSPLVTINGVKTGGNFFQVDIF